MNGKLSDNKYVDLLDSELCDLWTEWTIYLVGSTSSWHYTYCTVNLVGIKLSVQ